MFAGVPLIPFLIVTGAFLLIAVWTFYLVSAYISLFCAMAYVPVALAMRMVTKKDDQRLRQLVLRLKLRYHHLRGRRNWSATSFSPLRYKRRSSP